MIARRQPLWCRRKAAWQILFCLTVLSFISRAVIPIGYMPDLSGERDTPFAITLCSMNGGITVMLMDTTGEPQTGDSQDVYGVETCPYGLTAVHKLMPGQDAPGLAGAVTFLALALPPLRQTQPPLPALGPPLGSRAPPFLAGWLQA